MKTPSQSVPPDESASLPAVVVTELIDPTAVGQSVDVIVQDVVKLSASPLHGRRVVVRCGSCLVVFHSTDLPVRARTRLEDGLVAYTAFGPRSVGTVNGLPVGPNRIVACASGNEVEFIVASGYESVAFLVPPEMLRVHAIGRHREEEVCVPLDIKFLTPPTVAVRELYEWGRRLVELAARQPDVFDVPQTQSAVRVELLEKLLTTLGSASQLEPSQHEHTQQVHSGIVKVAEKYALSQVAERIHVTDLCEAAGVSERTLQYAFKELLGMTPMAYLIQLRLHRARQSIQAATYASTTVAKEALRWGFWHFGDFSRAYKECFGELPSDTLRKKPDA